MMRAEWRTPRATMDTALSQKAISFKGRVMPLTVLQLHAADPARIREDLAAEVGD